MKQGKNVLKPILKGAREETTLMREEKDAVLETRQKRFETNTQEKVKKWTLELQKFAPFTTLHYILLLLNCLAFRLQTFLVVLLSVILQISWLASR